eukprot:g2536.t1
MTDRFQSAAKKAAEAAPADITTLIVETNHSTQVEDPSFQVPSSKLTKKTPVLEEEFENFMNELVNRGLISQREQKNEQIVLGEVEGIEDWKEVLDSATQRTYYWNDRTDEVVWENPSTKDPPNHKPQETMLTNDDSVTDSPQIEDYEEELLIESIRKLRTVKCPLVSDGVPVGHCGCAVRALSETWDRIAETLNTVMCSESVCSSCSLVFNEQISEALNQVTQLLNSANSDQAPGFKISRESSQTET